MTVTDYRDLKRQIIQAFVQASESKPHVLGEFIKFYQNKINSRRRLEDIETISNLLNILEKRDVLSEDDVEPLEEIARRLSNSQELLLRISKYKTEHVAREYVNFYSAENSQNTTMREPPQSILNSHPFGPGVSNQKLERIRNIIIKQIGSCWRDLGRNLTREIRECDLDKIELEHHRLEAKALELMLLYERLADPQRWFMVLCNALEKSRRKDLKQLIQEAMTMNM